MLCLGAILKSEQASSEEVAVCCQKLLEISTKRSYLAVASIQLIVDHLPKISEEDFAEHVWPKLCSVCSWKGSGVKIESLWLLLEINSAFPKIPSKSYMQENFNRKKLLSDKLPQEIADVLMVSMSLFLHFLTYDRDGGGGCAGQGVPRHTQYLALHLVKTMFIPEKFGVRYLCAHPMFSGFHQLCF